MELKDVILPDYCKVLNETTKTEVIIELASGLEGFAGKQVSNGVLDVEDLKKELFYREQLMSTGLSMGLAVPHVRFKGVKKPIIIVGVQPRGINNYESMDGIPVTIVILIIVGAEQHKEHIRLLSMIASKLKDKKLRDRLLAAKCGSEIYDLLAFGLDGNGDAK